MKLIVERISEKNNSLFGRLLLINDEGDIEFICDTLESVSHKIQLGSYVCKMRWSNKFQTMLPAILSIKKRGNIRIHAGCYAYDSQGSILVGELNKEGECLINSRAVLAKLLERLPSLFYITVTTELSCQVEGK